MRVFHISKAPWLALSVLGVLSLAACGGGGGDENENGDLPEPITVESTPNFDGGTAVNNSTDSASSAAIPLVGDGGGAIGGATIIYNGIWSFELPTLPPLAEVTQVTLYLYQTGVAGDPQASFSLARMDHVNIGNSFPATSATIANLSLNFSQIVDLNTAGSKQVDVTDEVIADYDAARPRSSFRMRMAIPTDNDSLADWCVMTDAETAADASQRPRIVIEYTVP